MLLVQGRDLEKLRPQGRRAGSSREEAAGARDGTGSQERERVVRAKLRPGAVGSGGRGGRRAHVRQHVPPAWQSHPLDSREPSTSARRRPGGARAACSLPRLPRRPAPHAKQPRPGRLRRPQNQPLLYAGRTLQSLR